MYGAMVKSSAMQQAGPACKYALDFYWSVWTIGSRKMIRLLIADDHLLFRQGLRRLLADEADLDIVAEAANCSEVIDAVRNQDIDVAVLDLNMPGRSGAEMIRQVKAMSPFVNILVLSMHSEESLVLAALKAGASGYMTKEDAADEVVTVIRRLAHGGRYVCQQVAESIAFGMSSPDDNKPPHTRLSARELRILEMLSAGKRGSEIAGELSLSEKTVSTHKTNLLRKLNLHNNAELVVYAVNHGLNMVSI
jgi:DNA-binding NarL/FixJ family response regulator